jgi:ABC-type lipoprotein release transport system permease subunit
MNLLLRLALKNLTRNRRRTALTMISIIAGIGILIVGEAFISGTEENIFVSAEDGVVGHVMARPEGYPSQGLNAPLDRLLTVTPAARALLDAQTVAWTGRVLFAPTAVHGAESLRVRAFGYEPGRDEKVFSHERWKIDGRYPNPEADEVTVSPSVARLLLLKPDDTLVLQVRTHHGAINALEVKVAGILTTGNTALDGLGLFAPMALTTRLTGADAPTHLSAKLSRRALAPDFKPRLLAVLQGAEVSTVQEETAELISLQAVRRKSLDVLVFILLALAGFGMANTFLMAAYERTREVGTLRAMGMTEGAVTGLFLTEGSIVGLVGSVLGAAWGSALAVWWSIHPIDISQALSRSGASGSGTSMAFSALIYTAFDPWIAVVGVALGLTVAIVSSWYPARVASAMRPADAVRA